MPLDVAPGAIIDRYFHDVVQVFERASQGVKWSDRRYRLPQ